jgi:hypothetical protein
MHADTRAPIAKIRALPAERIAEVEDFVDFIAPKTRQLAALDRLLTIAPALEAAGAPPMTEQELAVGCQRCAAHGEPGVPERIVPDTNVALSALLWRRTPYRLLEAIRRQEHG